MSAITAVTIGPCRGWLHHAPGDRGVVMCAPLGYEALNSHYAWRVLAERVAAAGLPTLRFDYPGTADSLGDPDDPQWLASARASIVEACGWMRETLGVSEIVLVGMKLGAALAAEAGGVERLVQIAPVVRGDSYLRELRVLSRMLQASGLIEAGAADDIVLEGFAVNQETKASIKQIDLTRLDAAPAARVLVMTDTGARAVSAYTAHLTSLGAEIETRTFENYAALTPAPTPPAPPLSDFDAIVAWIAEGVGAGALMAPSPTALCGDSFVEKVIRFGMDEAVAGVLCEPSEGKMEKTVVILNTGTNAHIGCGRMHVELARLLAVNGVASLRMDVQGIGESAHIPNGPRAAIYRTRRQGDVFAAIDWLSARGHAHISLLGVCSGATLALLSAAADHRVENVLLGNIQVFNDLQDDELIESMLEKSFGATATYVAKATSVDAWARVLRGEVPPAKLLKIAGALLQRKATTLSMAITMTLGVSALARKAKQAHGYFETLSRRGARCLVLHGDHDVGLEELTTLFGRDGKRLRGLPGVRLETVAQADHLFASVEARKSLSEQMLSLLGVDDLTSNAATSRPIAASPEAVICIPTFHRPDMLAATLESLEAQQTSISFAVVIVDNDDAGREGLAVAQRFLNEGRLQGMVAAEAQQGNVHAINAAFGLARRAYPQSEFFLMIDDDEYAEPNWLEDMVDAARREKADIVGGPVAPIFPEGATPAFHDHPVYWPLYSQSGPVPMIFGSGNCLIARRVFEGLASPEFDPAFNFLGGGDTEFFTRCRKAGYSFYWRQEARLREQVTPNRLALKWVMHRSIATGVINYRIDRLDAHSLQERLMLIVKNIAIAPLSLLRAARMLGSASHPASALHPLGVAIGRWLALVGLDPQPYRRSAR